MYTIEFKRFGKWCAVATRSSISDARTFISERAPFGDWARTTRVVGANGSVWSPGA